jgi:hypothetical protein
MSERKRKEKKKWSYSGGHRLYNLMDFKDLKERRNWRGLALVLC